MFTRPSSVESGDEMQKRFVAEAVFSIQGAISLTGAAKAITHQVW